MFLLDSAALGRRTSMEPGSSHCAAEKTRPACPQYLLQLGQGGLWLLASLEGDGGLGGGHGGVGKNNHLVPRVFPADSVSVCPLPMPGRRQPRVVLGVLHECHDWHNNYRLLHCFCLLKYIAKCFELVARRCSARFHYNVWLYLPFQASWTIDTSHSFNTIHFSLN